MEYFEPEEVPRDGEMPGKPDIGGWDPDAQAALQNLYDQLGEKAGKDPVEFAKAREEYLKNEKQIKEKPGPDGKTWKEWNDEKMRNEDPKARENLTQDDVAALGKGDKIREGGSGVDPADAKAARDQQPGRMPDIPDPKSQYRQIAKDIDRQATGGKSFTERLRNMFKSTEGQVNDFNDLSPQKKGQLNDAMDRMKKRQKTWDDLNNKVESGQELTPEDKGQLEKLQKEQEADANKCRDLLKELDDKWDKQQQKNNEKSGEVKQKGKYSNLWMFLKLLAVIGGTLAAYLALQGYCNAHSGCLAIEYDGNNVTNNKIFCHGDMVSSSEANNELSYTSEQCYCSQLSSHVEPTKDNGCGYGTGNNAIYFTPDNSGFKGVILCNPKDGVPTSTGTYRYYSYQKMSLLDGVLDIGGKVLDGGESLLKMIFKYAMYFLAAVLGFSILYFIFKRYSEGGEKSSSFGGYLGNLSKYNNYAYMGRCGYSNNIPYRYLAAKNLINM